ncbi:GNAT family N-acetyltransferase [Bombella apis]|uniref:GNAT family N-acetyltransferase n=1 Tax=Bombella apis TaxID=1785988 RepID=UPI0024A82A83|nr:GNAT family N-acetyltransferase [Bombella apis]
MPDTAPSRPHTSIFHQEWWLATASRQAVSFIDVEMGGRVVSRFPFVMKKRLGSPVIRMPKYTRTLGPDFALPPSKTFRQEQNIRHVVDRTLASLPKYHGVHFYLDPDNASSFAFRLAGFRVYQDFTFRIMPEKTLDMAWQDCDQKTRNLIRTADKKLTVQQSGDVAPFIDLVRQELPQNHHDYALLEDLFTEARNRDQAMALYAHDGGVPVSAALLVWDDRVLYYWQAVRVRRSRVPGMNMLLIWKAIEEAKRRNLIFDFDGFGSVRTAKMLASFGQKPVIRPEIRFETPLYAMKCRLINVVRRHVLRKYRGYDLF